MNTYFFENFTQNLINEQFQPINFNFNQLNINLFLKQFGSSLYVVFPSKILNSQIKYLEEKIMEHYNKTYISKIFFIEILIPNEIDTKIIEYSYFETDFENKLIKLRWLVDTKNEKLIINGNQPNDILNLKKLINSSFKFFENNKSINEMIEENNIKNISKLKSNNINLTLALILILCFIHFYSVLNNLHSLWIFKGSTTPNMFEKGQFYRIFTHAFLHSNISHLLSNCLSLYIFGSRVEKYMGKLNFTIIYLVGIIISFWGSYIFNRGFSIGASGAIFALEGAILYFAIKTKQKVDGLDFIFLLTISIFSISIGLSTPNVDNSAHLFGFLAGIIISFFMCLKK